MTDAIWKIFSVLVIVMLLTACGNSNQGTSEPDVPGTVEEETETPEAIEEETESPDVTEEEIESAEPFDLPQGESAAPGTSLASNLTTTNVEQTMYEFLEYVLLDVHQYWTNIMVQSGFQEPTITYIFPLKGETVLSTCSNQYTNDNAAFYRAKMDTIVISQDVATRIWLGEVAANDEQLNTNSAGDFSVAVAVAHEYAHSLQAEIGWVTETGIVGTARSIELNADCLAGVWANSVYARGLLEQGDIEETMRLMSDIGEDYDNIQGIHGFPGERTEAFTVGYLNGSAASCDPYLQNAW